MIKEWATVISWHQGIAELRCEKPAGGCGNCSQRDGCGSRVLNDMGPDTQHLLRVKCPQPLAPGQRVEVGIPEASLIRSSLLVYMLPLVCMLLLAAVMQGIYSTDSAAITGGLAGVVGGFLLAHLAAAQLAHKPAYQPVIIQIALTSC